MKEENSASDASFNDAPKKHKTPPSPKKIPKKITESYLANSGKFYLERFPASIGQFRKIMARKIQKSCKAHPDQSLETCNEYLETVIEKFRQLGFLNDEGYAAGLTRSLKNRGWPRGRIIMRLKEKSIPSDIIEQLFADTPVQDDFYEAVRWIKRKRLGNFSLREKPFEKQLASMGRAGFDYHAASRALKLDKEESEKILNENI